MLDFQKIASAVSRCKSYFSVVGLCCIVFYLIADRLLSLGIFSQLKEGNTYSILSSMLWYFFLLALIAVSIGGVGFLLDKMRFKADPNSRQNDLVISDVSLRKNPDYEAVSEREGGMRVKKK